MYKLVRTNSSDPDFRDLVIELDKDLTIRDGDEHPFYDQYNKLDTINYVVVIYEDKIPSGCGAFKEYAEKIAEIKRMFVPPEKRGRGIASLVLTELETWAKELNYEKCILETGLKQPEAISLYKKNKYTVIPNYEPYKNAENSVCFEKSIK
jgi:putative acetyltransferase